MCELKDSEKDDYIKYLEGKNARLSRLLDISEVQKERLKTQCVQLRKTASDILSEKNA